MPIPTYDFDPFDPIPRKAVPVRFACLVADWTPAFLAKCVVDMVGPEAEVTPFASTNTIPRAMPMAWLTRPTT